MARIASVTLPGKKRIEAALPYLYGIGLSRAKVILQSTKIDPNKRADDLTESEVNAIKEFIDRNYKIEGGLRQQILLDIKRLKEIGAYRGIRHAKGLPVRGQRTKTNSRTRRGNVRKTAGSGKKKAADKT